VHLKLEGQSQLTESTGVWMMSGASRRVAAGASEVVCLPIGGRLFAFDAAGVARAPEEPGVFALYEGKELVYYGHAVESVRSRIQAMYDAREESCVRLAVLYSFEICDQPEQRELELVREYQIAHGKRPKCNALLA